MSKHLTITSKQITESSVVFSIILILAGLHTGLRVYFFGAAGLFDNVWIQPAAGDAVGAIGAALAGWHIALEKERIVCLPYMLMVFNVKDSLKTSLPLDYATLFISKMNASGVDTSLASCFLENQESKGEPFSVLNVKNK